MNLKLKNISPFILRLGIGFVFLWFGLNEILNPLSFISYIPTDIVGIFSLTDFNLVVLSGIFEIIFSLFLIFGIWIRWTAILLAFHLLLIILSVGFDAIGIRDLGLFFSLIAIIFNDKDDYILFKK